MMAADREIFGMETLYGPDARSSGLSSQAPLPMIVNVVTVLLRYPNSGS